MHRRTPTHTPTLTHPHTHTWYGALFSRTHARTVNFAAVTNFTVTFYVRRWGWGTVLLGTLKFIPDHELVMEDGTSGTTGMIGTTHQSSALSQVTLSIKT